MRLKQFALVLFLTLTFFCVLHAVYYYPQLPETVAMHFNAAGRPDAWAPKEEFIKLYLSTLAFSAAVFLGIAFGLPRLPTSMINLPNREYWLSPEQKQRTLGFLSTYFLWFASATVALLCDVMHQAFQVHLGKAAALPHPVLSIGLYLGFAFVWMAGLFLRFAKRRT